MTRASSVAVVGAGSVGSAIANALMYAEECADLVLFDIDFERARAEAYDIADGTPQTSAVRVRAAGTIDELEDAAIVVITAGAKRRGAETRLQLLDRNSALVASLIDDLDRVAPDAVIVLVTNPVDVVTRIAIERSRRPAGRVFGCGTLLDSSRLRVQLAALYDVSVSSVDVMVLGEHGDSSVAAWSSATIGSVRLSDLPIPAGRSFAEIKEDAMLATRMRAAAIHEAKGFTNYGIAAAMTRILKAVIDDERAVLPVSVRAIDYYGIGSNVVLSLPSVVGRAGIEQTIVINLDESECLALRHSATELEHAYAMRTADRLQPAGPA